MTVPVEATYVRYLGNGSATTFAFEGNVAEVASIKAKVIASDGTETALVSGVDFSVEVAADKSGATITYTEAGVPMPTGSTLVIWRETPQDQLVDISNQGTFNRETMEDALDKGALIDQELNDGISRALRAAPGDGPLAPLRREERKLRYPFFDAAGDLTLRAVEIAVGDPSSYIYPTRTVDAAATVIPGSVAEIWCMACTSPADGGHGFWKRVNSEPAHEGKFRSADRFLASGVEDLTDGGWWEISQQVLCPKMFSTTDDDAAWAGLKSVIETVPWWKDGFGIAPSKVDLRGFSHTLTSSVIIARGVHLANGEVIFTENALTGDYGLCLGINASSGASYTQLVENMNFTHETLTANQPAAMLFVPRTFAPHFINVNCRGSDSTFRTRYGLYAGRYRGWSGDVLGGRFYGNECNLRIGRENDHTGWNIYPDVCDHGRLMNVLLCNPRGFNIGGRLEQSDGPFNLVITSQTNGSVNVAGSGTLHSAYMFNDGMSSAGQGDVGWSNGNSIVRFGKDVPGTEGWDQAGVITSGAAGDNFTIRDSYMVSDAIQCVAQLRGVAGFRIENVTWFARGRINANGVTGTFQAGETIRGATSGATAVIRKVTGNNLFLASDVRGPNSPGNKGDIIPSVFIDGETITGDASGATGTVGTAGAGRPRLAEFEGSCARSHIRSTRNQNTGTTIPVFSSEASNFIGVDLEPSQPFDPRLVGDGTEGALNYNRQAGVWSVRSNVLTVNADVTWTAITTPPVGNMILTLPSIVSRAVDGQRAAGAVQSANFATAPQALHFPTENHIRLYRTNTSARTPAADVGSSGDFHVSFSTFLDFAD